VLQSWNEVLQLCESRRLGLCRHRPFRPFSRGAGLKTGQIINATTSNRGEVLDNALRPGYILATMYHPLDIAPHQMLTDRFDRPVPLLPEGQPSANS
jgi:hypothetical protein